MRRERQLEGIAQPRPPVAAFDRGLTDARTGGGRHNCRNAFYRHPAGEVTSPRLSFFASAVDPRSAARHKFPNTPL
jgi:hypothetical protein